MWVLRAYSPETDELLDERELPGVPMAILARLVGRIPTPYVSNPLDLERLYGFAASTNLPLIKDAEYFLDFDADPDKADLKSSASPSEATFA